MEQKKIVPPYARLALGCVLLGIGIAAFVMEPAAQGDGETQDHYVWAGLVLGSGLALIVAAVMRFRMITVGRAEPWSDRLRFWTTVGLFACSLPVITLFGGPVTSCFSGSSMASDGTISTSPLRCSTTPLLETTAFWMLIGWTIALGTWLYMRRAGARSMTPSPAA